MRTPVQRHRATDRISTLRIFVAVSEQSSFRRAAAVLQLPASAVSRRVRALEEEIGVDLLERQHDGVLLTPPGRAFLRDAHRVLYELDRAVARAGRAGQADTGMVAIGFYVSLVSGRLRELLSAHRERWPDVEVLLHEADPVDQLAALRDRRLDLALLAGETTAIVGVDHELLWTERVHAALPVGHALASKGALRWGELAAETFIVRAYESGPVIYTWLAARLAPGGLLPRIVQHPVSRESLLGMVGAGFGLTVVSDAATSVSYPGVSFIPIEDDNATLPVTASWLPANANPALRRFLSFAREISRTSARA